MCVPLNKIVEYQCYYYLIFYCFVASFKQSALYYSIILIILNILIILIILAMQWCPFYQFIIHVNSSQPGVVIFAAFSNKLLPAHVFFFIILGLSI